MFYDLFVKTVHQVRRECSSSTTYSIRFNMFNVLGGSTTYVSHTRVRDGHVALHSNLRTTSQPHAMTLAVGLPNAIEAKLRV